LPVILKPDAHEEWVSDPPEAALALCRPYQGGVWLSTGQTSPGWHAILWNEGYWVRNSVKVELTRDEKVRIGRHFSPRWEIDLIAWHAARNELLALECKSYFDSGGVHAAHFQAGSRYAHRYKLFHDTVLRETVLERLRLQCIERGLCPVDATVRLGLIHGHATDHNAPLLAQIFEEGG
jgi:hypothetical protein